VNTRRTLSLAAAALSLTALAPTLAVADPWEVRREAIEGVRNVQYERREAAREIDRCRTRECVEREIREGRREVERERREAYQEVNRERHVDGFEAVRHGYPGRRVGWNKRAWYYRDAHYHPNGQYCSDGRHLVHFRDDYYRGDRRWYRDNRYWNEYDYVSRYYRPRYRDRNDNDDDGNDDLLRGIAIGAATVGVIAAIHEANDND
jgi:hypothetical protein